MITMTNIDKVKDTEAHKRAGLHIETEEEICEKFDVDKSTDIQWIKFMATLPDGKPYEISIGHPVDKYSKADILIELADALDTMDKFRKEYYGGKK